ncbi:hypothetical protein TNCV_980851 [Trichonephila clavipes]|uniref:Uncharacterized protein n=1 Tax=Trichonephila clavipes TaxID=2585209 RepID=A0A8X6VEE8_TRICX|nr:hypothetical protein TNCV_980851 [Trichonephila clavipes]
MVDISFDDISEAVLCGEKFGLLNLLKHTNTYGPHKEIETTMSCSRLHDKRQIGKRRGGIILLYFIKDWAVNNTPPLSILFCLKAGVNILDGEEEVWLQMEGTSGVARKMRMH